MTFSMVFRVRNESHSASCGTNNILAAPKQSFHKVFWVEFTKVLGPLAKTDVSNGDFEFVADCEDHPALCRSIELGEDDARESTASRTWLPARCAFCPSSHRGPERSPVGRRPSPWRWFCEPS